MKKIPLISSLILFVLLCVSGSYWVLQFIKPPVRKIIAPPVTMQIADVESVATLFGGAMSVATNYQLKGVVLANPVNQSVAILAVDGKQNQAFPINTEVSNGVRLVEVHADYVLLMDNGVNKRVELPQDAKSVSADVSNPANLSTNQATMAAARNDANAAHSTNNKNRFNSNIRPAVVAPPSTSTPPDFPPNTSGNGVVPNPPPMPNQQDH